MFLYNWKINHLYYRIKKDEKKKGFAGSIFFIYLFFFLLYSYRLNFVYWKCFVFFLLLHYFFFVSNLFVFVIIIYILIQNIIYIYLDTMFAITTDYISIWLISDTFHEKCFNFLLRDLWSKPIFIQLLHFRKLVPMLVPTTFTGYRFPTHNYHYK